MSTSFSEEDWRYLQENSFLSRNYHLHYLATPKVACTSLKWWFSSLEKIDLSTIDTRRSEESTTELIIHDCLAKAAPHITNLSKEVLSEVFASTDYFRFALVRNPYHRIFSAWQSKILFHEPARIAPYRNEPFLNQDIETIHDVALAFESFLEFLKLNEWPNIRDDHWRPQTTVLRVKKFHYSSITKIEESLLLWEKIKDQITHAGGIMPSFYRTNEGLLSFSSQFLTDRSKHLIRELYQSDFETFSYPIAVPDNTHQYSEVDFHVAVRAIHLIRGRGQRFWEVKSLLEEKTS